MTLVEKLRAAARVARREANDTHELLTDAADEIEAGEKIIDWLKDPSDKIEPGTFRIFRDGNSWCAVQEPFINLQESECGFGSTPAGALEDLLERMPA